MVGTGSIGIFLEMKDVSESRDYFSVVGISGGLGIFGGIDIMFAGEGLIMCTVKLNLMEMINQRKTKTVKDHA